jgi:hypothetical protein
MTLLGSGSVWMIQPAWAAQLQAVVFSGTENAVHIFLRLRDRSAFHRRPPKTRVVVLGQNCEWLVRLHELYHQPTNVQAFAHYFPHHRTYSSLGQQCDDFLDAPDVIGDASFHRRGDAQRLEEFKLTHYPLLRIRKRSVTFTGGRGWQARWQASRVASPVASQK